MSGFISLTGEGKAHQALGMTVTLRAVREDTGGTFEVFEGEFPAGLEFPMHVHRNSDEAFYVLDGEVENTLGDRTVTATAGTFLYAPRGTRHGFHNKAASPTRILFWQMPGPGMEKALEELSALRPGEPDMEKVLPILKKYDIEPVA